MIRTRTVVVVARETLVDVIQQRAAELGEEVWLRYLTTGDVVGPTAELSFGALGQRAEAIAAALQQRCRPGDRALLVFPSGLEFVTAFCACLFAGVIPVPVYPPDLAKPERGIAKIHAIARDCAPRLALTTSGFVRPLALVVPPGIETLATDVCDESLATEWRRPALTRDTIALLQYTSGSTGSPKGVIVRHRQLVANELSIEARMGPVELVVGWLPVFHDMGLIGNVLHGLCAGSSLVLMSPLAFLKRPARWLEAISHFRATTSGGPNFAYDLCTRRVSEEQRAQLDLTSWKVAFCGAEPVRATTIERFVQAFASCGFSRAAFYPCYGLAEATLFVTGAQRGTPPNSRTFDAAALDRGEVVIADDGPGARMLVSCGTPSATEEVVIVDGNAGTAVTGVGEIWVRGPAISSGYWGRDDNDAVFGARLADGRGPFLRTGDLGFMHDGQLYVCGRLKELIILGGRNLFPQDIEATVEETAPSLRKGCCVAFAFEHDGAERLVIAAEHDGALPDEIARAIKHAVMQQHQAAVFDVLVVEKGAIPKTSSGKLERYACRQIYAARSSRAI